MICPIFAALQGQKGYPRSCAAFGPANSDLRVGAPEESKGSCGRVARLSSAKAPTAVRIRSGPHGNIAKDRLSAVFCIWGGGNANLFAVADGTNTSNGRSPSLRCYRVGSPHLRITKARFAPQVIRSGPQKNTQEPRILRGFFASFVIQYGKGAT